MMSTHVGGCDQGRITARWIDTQEFRILSPSRPGYLGTSLEKAPNGMDN
jgi:hypothetical protein